MQRLSGCSERGLEAVAAEQAAIAEQVKEVQRIAATLDPKRGDSATRKQLGKMTLLEYESALRATPQGKEAWTANVKAAEAAYSRALTLEPNNTRAIRGQASLYDEDGRAAQALEGYRKYLELAPTAMDAYRIKKRIEDLEKASVANTAASSTQN